MTTLYVCEWACLDIALSEEIQLMRTYDYTYSPQLQSAQTLAQMEKDGYIIAKGLDPEDLHKIPSQLESLCIWVYSQGILTGKYDFYSEHWYYSAKNDNWDDEWKDMMTIPLPIQES